jgi:hypothetical protein
LIGFLADFSIIHPQANFMLSGKIKDFVRTVATKPLPRGWLKAVDLGCAGRLPETGEIKGSRGTPLYMVSYGVGVECC